MNRFLSWGWALMGGASLVACDQLPEGVAPAHPTAERGVTLADWTPDGYGQPASVNAIDEIAALGATHVILVPTAYQAGATDADPRSDPGRTPTLASVRTAIQAAQARGLEVALKPHVDRTDGGWRGDIRPANLDQWFASYRSFLLPWLQLAEDEQVQRVVIGTELANLVEFGSRWEALIATARGHFSGALGYAASWDEAALVPFWFHLDFVGIDFYYPVAARDDAGRWEILTHWQPWLQRLEVLHGQTGRPLVLTEIGYRSVDGAGLRPYEFGTAAPEDQREQADLYWAALAATAGRPWLQGLWWWNWLARGGGGPGDLDYTPRDKAAESILEAAWTR